MIEKNRKIIFFEIFFISKNLRRTPMFLLKFYKISENFETEIFYNFFRPERIQFSNWISIKIRKSLKLNFFFQKKPKNFFSNLPIFLIF